MYRPVATPLPSTPASRKAIRASSGSGVGSRNRPASTASPTTSALLTVPMPGTWRSGIHSSSTNTPTTMRTVPIDRPLRSARPWWSTSQGDRPRPASIMSARLRPYATSPSWSWPKRRPKRSRIGMVNGLPVCVTHATLKASWPGCKGQFGGAGVTGVLRGAQLARLLGHWHGLPGRRRRPDYLALADAVRGLLADGRLPLGVRLPAERELAEVLKISRTTVSAAYRELRDSGHLTSRRGAGSWTTVPRGHRVDTSGLWSPAEDRDVIDLGNAVLAAPPQLVDAVRAATEELHGYLASAGYYPTGIPELREAVAATYAARGL